MEGVSHSRVCIMAERFLHRGPQHSGQGLLKQGSRSRMLVPYDCALKRLCVTLTANAYTPVLIEDSRFVDICKV